jgi:predicted enzyme related to lactoylglutathione lyase
MAESSGAGRFVWHELLTTDTAAASAFYTKVVGWTTKPWANDANYTLFMSGSKPAAGLMILPDEAKKMGAPPNWMSYIGTANVDETVTRLVALGGTVLRAAADVPDVGRFAIVRDPQGAVFGLLTSARPSSVSDTPAVGDFSWHELMTPDQNAALAFYQALFGWQKVNSMDMGAMGSYDIFGWDGQQKGGMMKPPPARPRPGCRTPSWRTRRSPPLSRRSRAAK